MFYKAKMEQECLEEELKSKEEPFKIINEKKFRGYWVAVPSINGTVNVVSYGKIPDKVLIKAREKEKKDYIVLYIKKRIKKRKNYFSKGCFPSPTQT
jgi:hypothetical protein